MAALPNHFAAFHSKLAPTTTEIERIKAAVSHLKDVIDGDSKLAGLKIAEPFLQGSYKNSTLTRPLKGDFDVDLAFPVDGKDAKDSERLLETVANRLRLSGEYDQRISRKPRCLRIHYANEFHVDLVPMQPLDEVGSLYAVSAPERTSGWRETNPRQLDEWIHTTNKETGGRFVRVMKMVKRWRERNFAAPRPSGIMLTVFAGTHHPYLDRVRKRSLPLLTKDVRTDTDAVFLRDLIVVMDDCADHKSNPFTILNPFIATENLAREMDDDAVRDFKRKLKSFHTMVQDAYREPDEQRSAEKWREIFGDDFPLEP